MIDVLLIDDEKHFLHDLADGLRLYSNKINVITAENGRIALEILKTALIDVVVTDLNMPGMDGYELLRKLQMIKPKIPVIVMSAYARSSVEQRLQGTQLAEYLEKPLDLGAVAEAILAAA
jgi:two-component system NtrC family response regulator